MIIATAISMVASAQAKKIDEKYYQIGSVKIVTKEIVIQDQKQISGEKHVEELSIKDWDLKQELANERRENLFKKFEQSAGGDISFDQIINYGAKLWKLVEANKPVVNFNGVNANALPSNVDGNWLALENWQAPKGSIYSVTYKNLYGAEVVRFDYRILFTSGGNLAGNGQYLSNVSVNPQNLWVAWGYNVEALAKVVNVINTSSKANPVAGMEVLVDWRVKTVLRDMRSSTSFFMKGDGEFVDLNGLTK
jgi:hypothetical protein